MTQGSEIVVFWHGQLIKVIFIKVNEHGSIVWRYPHENEEDLEL
jgi:hypothetical protein